MPTPSTHKLARAPRQKRKEAKKHVKKDGPAELKPVGKLGLSAAIQRLHEAERLSHAAYVDAVQNGGDVFNRINEWTKLVEQLRKTEKDIGEINRDRSESLAVQDVEREWSRMVRMLLAMVEARDRSIVDLIVGLDKPSMTEVLTKKRRELFQQIASRQWRDDTATPES